MSGRLFHKAYSNRSIVHAGEAGISSKIKLNKNKIIKMKEIRDFLEKFQSFYKMTGRTMLIPLSLEKDISLLRLKFNIYSDNISNMMQFIENNGLNGKDLRKYKRIINKKIKK